MQIIMTTFLSMMVTSEKCDMRTLRSYPIPRDPASKPPDGPSFGGRGRRQVCFDITCHPCSVSRTLLGPLLASRHNLGEEGFGNLCACAYQKKENQGPNLFGRRRGKGGRAVVTLQERQEVPRCWLLRKELGIEAWTPGRWASSSTDVHRYEVGIADKGELA